MDQRLKLTRRQLGMFLEDFESVKQFENLFSVVDSVTVVGGGTTYDDLPQVGAAAFSLLAKILTRLEALETQFPGGYAAAGKKLSSDLLTRLEALETDHPGNTKAWVVRQKFLGGTKVDSFNTRTGAITLSSGDVTAALTFTPVNKAGDTGLGAMQMTTVRATNAGGYISSDGSTGATTTITTASLVGKTITVKDGIITGFA